MLGKISMKKLYVSDTKSKQIEEKKQCRICVNKKKGKCYHSEENCWFKNKNQKAVLKTVNNWKLN